MNSTTLQNWQKFNLHALVISLLILIPTVVTIQPLLDYASQIVEARKQEGRHLLPDFCMHYPANSELANKLPHLLVDQVSKLVFLSLLPHYWLKNYLNFLRTDGSM